MKKEKYPARLTGMAWQGWKELAGNVRKSKGIPVGKLLLSKCNAHCYGHQYRETDKIGYMRFFHFALLSIQAQTISKITFPHTRLKGERVRQDREPGQNNQGPGICFSSLKPPILWNIRIIHKIYSKLVPKRRCTHNILKSFIIQITR